MKPKVKKIIPGTYYNAGFLNGPTKKSLIQEIENLHPIWEERYSPSNPPPEGDTWRSLKRPVYWLGNWQYACLGYYHPPDQIDFRCVKAEAFPPVMQKMVNEIEVLTRRLAPKSDVPSDWHLNTCLVNYYGSRIDPTTNKEVDLATVGDHKDAEPGPVASISLGEKAWFQFVKGKNHLRDNVQLEQWLDDGSLFIFWNKKFKDELFHRVQRVDNKNNIKFIDHLEGYRTRRINLTFRFVPVKDIIDYKFFPQNKKDDINEYVKIQAKNSNFFKQFLE